MYKDIEDTRNFFKNDRYATELTGAYIEEAKENYAKISLKLNDGHKNAIGAVMGGVHCTLADFCFAVASNTAGIPTVTLTSQINYLGRVKGDTLFAESRLIKDGKSICFYEIKIYDNLGTDVAIVSVTGMHTGS